ncbi:ABC transporter permease subunit [Paenibacillus arenilitoris]|uniref:ABC transporter permease subunit n=1 Tax=Paenibacillus arenilitoris TaxID=2772299 RepID=A0A927H560_9BACL|nr:ABC transporter permease subunit [Paenibacillus arenilitoris]MBD2867214.1 ABC transporter permease subunit [Paenibacillus arenilitoris]
MSLRSRIAVFMMCAFICTGFLPMETALGNAQWTLDEPDNITSLSVSEDGSRIAVGSYGAKAYSFTAEGQLQFALEAGNVVTGVAMLSDGSLLAASDDRHLYKADEQGRLQWDLNVKRQVKGVSASHDGSVAAYIVQGSTNVAFIDAETGETIRETDIGIAPKRIRVAPSGSFTAAGATDQYVYLIDADGGIVRKMGVTGTVEAVAAAEDGSVAVGTSKNEVVLFDADGREAGSYPVKDAVTDVDVSGDGSYVAVSDYLGGIYVFAREGKLLWTTEVDGAGRAVAFNKDATALYAGTGSGTLHAYDVSEAIASAESGAVVRTVAWTIAAALALALLILGLLWMKRRRKLGVLRDVWRAKYIYLALLPTFALVFVFLYYPASSGLFHSLYDWNPGGRTTFVGLANFERMLSDPYVTKGIGNLGLLIVTGLAKTLIPPLIVAELIYHLRSKKTQYWYRTAFVASMVIPAVAGLLIWQNLYDPNVGLFNKLLAFAGLPGHAWLGDPDTALWAIIFIGFPFIGILQLLVFYSGLLAIPDELIESARIDGAGLWRIIRSIHLPLLAGQFKLLIILSLIGIIQDFGGILIVTGGGPMDSTYVPALQMYYAATIFNDLGYASALGVAMFLIILIITVINMKFLKTTHD